MHIRLIMNKEKEENNSKKENQSKQTKDTINSSKRAGIAAKPRDNSEMNESVEVSNSTVQLRNAKQRIYLSKSN